MESILDFNIPLDVSLFDKVVNAMYFSSGNEVTISNKQANAQKVLGEFQKHPSAWDRVDQIFTSSQVVQAKYIALQVLETMVTWV